MRYQSGSLLLAVLFAACSSGASSQTLPYKVIISLPQQSFKLGQPILAHVSLQNISKEKVVVARANGTNQAQFNYKITVSDNGQALPLKSSIHRPGQIPKPTSWSNVGEDLAPNKILEEDCPITELFALDKPGNYVLEFARWIPGTKNTFVHSNSITFSILK